MIQAFFVYDLFFARLCFNIFLTSYGALRALFSNCNSLFRTILYSGIIFKIVLDFVYYGT